MPIVRNEEKSKRRTLVLAGILLAALLALILYRWRSNGFDWLTFARTFTGVDWWWLSGSVPLILAAYAVRAVRWQTMIRPARPASSFWNIFVATAIGFTAIVFFGRAGELVRPYLIAGKEKLNFSSQAAAWLLERILDLIMVLLLFGFALFQISKSGISPGPRLRVLLETGGSIVGLAGAACLALLLGFRFFGDRARARIIESISFLPDAYRLKIDSLIASFATGMEATRSNRQLLGLLLWSIVEWTLIVACYVFILKSFPSTSAWTLTDVVIFMGFVSFGAAVQIPGVGGGVQVASILVFTEFFGIPFESATGLALVMWGITFVIIVPIGVVLAFREGLNWRSLSRISTEEGSA